MCLIDTKDVNFNPQIFLCMPWPSFLWDYPHPLGKDNDTIVQDPQIIIIIIIIIIMIIITTVTTIIIIIIIIIITKSLLKYQ